MIEGLAQEYEVDWLCQLFGLPRSTYYYQSTRTADDPQLVQAIETLHVQLLKDQDVVISMSDAGQPTQNAFIERFIKTVKYEHVYYSEYDTVTDMRKQLKFYLEVEYNRDRSHSALGYTSPSQFEKEYYWLHWFFDY